MFENFVKFKILVENQFTTKIKHFQLDDGGEYTSIQFQSFLSQNGIVHRKSCPYTSQHNGLAERKLRHTLETSLTLLAHSHLSNKYWVDAFLIAVYVINGLPTLALQKQSPYTKLYNRDPDYQKLRVFGCLCYPLLKPYGLNKLKYRSKPCIFLGYNYDGYKCLDPVTNKVYLSKHVILNEDSFLAKDQATTQFPSMISAQGDSSLFLLVSLPLNCPFSVEPNSSTTTVSPEPISPIIPASTPFHPYATLDVDTIHPPLRSPASTSITNPVTSSIPSANLPISIIGSPLPHIASPIPHTNSSMPPASFSLPPPTHTMVTRSQTGSYKPKTFPKYQFHHTQLVDIEPVTYCKVATDARWMKAMQ